MEGVNSLTGPQIYTQYMPSTAILHAHAVTCSVQCAWTEGLTLEYCHVFSLFLRSHSSSKKPDQADLSPVVCYYPMGSLDLSVPRPYY